MSIPYLLDTVILFGAALTVIVLSQRFRVPPIVGFLVTGAAVGPSGLGLIAETGHIQVFAELGVVFLLFVIGLELSLGRLKKLRRFLFVGGVLQAGATFLVAAGAGWMLRLPGPLAIFLGFVVTMSSTAIVLKLYLERHELEAPHGQAATGMLLFQDFLIVPLLLVVPLLAPGSAGLDPEHLKGLGADLLLLVAVFAVAWIALPWLVGLIVRTRVRELLVLVTLFLCLGAAAVTEHLGFSLALGAFLVGILIAETGYHPQVIAEIGPFRDVFNSLFFISVGMLFSLDFAARHAGEIVAVALGVIAVKSTIVVAVVAALGFGWRIRVLAGLGLAQMGEFSFVLLRAGSAQGLISNELYQLMIGSAILTMIATPLLIGSAPRLAGRFPVRDRDRTPHEAEDGSAPSNHVIIFGFGLNGRHLARVLRPAGIPYLGVDLDPTVVKRAEARGEPILYGDASRPEIQERCGLERAAVAVFAISDPVALRYAVRLAREHAPELFIVARTRKLEELEEFELHGASEVVAEELESSIEIVTHVLRRFHVPGNVIRAEARLLREDGYQMLRSMPPPRGFSERLIQALAAGASDTFILWPEHAAVGTTLRELELRKTAGATVIAVVRGEETLTNPSADLCLAAGDLLVLVGGHVEIERAFRLLERTAGEP